MNEMQHLEDQVREVNGKTDTIIALLQGNKLDKDDKGMIGVQNDHEKRIMALEKFWDRGKWILIGLALTGGWGAIDIIQKIFLKH